MKCYYMAGTMANARNLSPNGEIEESGQKVVDVWVLFSPSGSQDRYRDK